MAVRRRQRRNGVLLTDANPRKRTQRRRRRSTTATTTRSNPSGISGIVMGGVWVGAGMYLGGIVGGFLTPLTGGIIGSLPFGGVLQGLVNAYVVQMIAGRFTRNAGLMAAGAFAGTAMGALSGVLGGVSSAVGGVTSAITGSGVQRPKQSGALGAGQAANNVIQMPTQVG